MEEKNITTLAEETRDATERVTALLLFVLLALLGIFFLGAVALYHFW